jgi:predicted restriction endonuclease
MYQNDKPSESIGQSTAAQLRKNLEQSFDGLQDDIIDRIKRPPLQQQIVQQLIQKHIQRNLSSDYHTTYFDEKFRKNIHKTLSSRLQQTTFTEFLIELSNFILNKIITPEGSTSRLIILLQSLRGSKTGQNNQLLNDRFLV